MLNKNLATLNGKMFRIAESTAVQKTETGRLGLGRRVG